MGTTSIEDSEELSFMLKKKAIPHNVLNAKYHEREAYIVAQAGRLGQVTIATNMAGRGTDIILGGNIEYFVKDVLSRNKIFPEDERYQDEFNKIYQKYKSKFEEEHRKVVELGGLHVIGAQRHEARRIDNQLKGRAGRQGDPGSSRFYISLEDDLMRLFGSERIYFLMDKFGFPEDEPIEHPLITRSIEVAQKRVETYNFEIRKDLLKFDDVMNRQRETIYRQRREILENEDIREDILAMMDDVVDRNVSVYVAEEYNLEALKHWLKVKFGVDIDIKELEEIDIKEFGSFIKRKLRQIYEEKEASSNKEERRAIEKFIALSVIDTRWKEHLLVMDTLREGIYLRGHANVDPLVEYQKESFFAFSGMIDSIKEQITELVFRARISPQKEIKTVFSTTPKNFVHSEYSSLKSSKDESKPTSPVVKTEKKKVGRNDPCPCGSGKKYKKCCGR